MLDKFQRSFYITAIDLESTPTKVLTIQPPFTVVFAVNRSFWGSPNSATIKIYNLNENTRAFLRKDRNNWGYKKALIFSAGYGNNLSTLTRGNIQYCQSYREGSNFITEIQIMDGGAAFLNSSFSGQFVKDTDLRSIIKTVAASMSDNDVQVGAISDSYKEIVSKRGSSYSGSAIDILQEISGNGVFIDNGVVNIIRDGEFIKGDTLIVSSQTGLIGVPKREWQNVTFEMILEPRVYIAQKIQIKIGSKQFDGDYVIRSISHSGTISEAVGQKATTSITCTQAEVGMKGLLKNG